MSALIWILGATIITSLVAFIGIFSLWMSKNSLNKILLILVAFSAGALLSGAFFHLLSEALEELDTTTAFIYLFIAFILFFLIERILHWHHCHDGECDVHSFTYMILLGDGIHNFIDGLIIAASFMVDIGFGIITTLLIIGHEVPQELGDFGILVYGGFSRTKALVFNFLSQLACVIGGLIGFFLSQSLGFTVLLLPFAAGGFIYIAASDLIPELHKEASLKKSMISFAFFIIGILFTFSIKIIFEG
ncbi:MAG: ZIP family metal transporter [archaeon]